MLHPRSLHAFQQQTQSVRYVTLACRLRFLTALLLLCVALTAQAQTATASAATDTFHGWDVISVKPNKSGSGAMMWDNQNTFFRGENIDTWNLLRNAYGIRQDLITGLPAWAKSMHWDVNAKLVDPAPVAKGAKRTQQEEDAADHARVLAILQERFHLKAHTETKVLPIYNLVVAKNGPKLKKADAAELDKGSMSWSNNNIKATALFLKDFASIIEGEAGHSVVDKTALPGQYDVELRWSREDKAISTADNGAADRPPTFFTALEEQLGLKLVPDKGPVTTLVVDSIEMPVED